MDSEKMMKARALAEALGDIGVSTIYRMAKDGRIPCYDAGKKGVRFNVHEVLAALKRPIKSEVSIR